MMIALMTFCINQERKAAEESHKDDPSPTPFKCHRSQNQVFLGRPLFLFRLGFQVKDGCRLTNSVSYPSQMSQQDAFVNRLLLCSLLVILSGQRILRIFLRQVLMKNWSFVI
ncbi:hypothetical protein DPMN_055826 [Dreissena polymorpha]|uniref:Uncharacterized protein n=1 Tax=Dreissena polymorpha TaxID=45954 RepID=A0A9D4CT54_DREPO|nr:hypothetical protein DPMN_055826 [Dreissena polymorpha]